MSGTLITPLSVAIDFGTLADATTSAVWENMRGAAATISISGTFGGATVVIEGSDAVGGTYSTLTAAAGAASYTAAATAQIAVMPRFWRVRSSGGTGTSVQVIATLYLDPPLRGPGPEAPVYRSGTAIVAQVPDSTAAGGNVRGANAVDLQTVRDAATRVASGANAVIAGGSTNTASALGSAVLGGLFNNASGQEAAILGGNGNNASGIRSWIPGGQNATTRGLRVVGAWSGGQFVALGDAQAEEHILRRQTTDATATRLTSDAAAAATTNTINLSNFSAIAGWLVVRARAASGANLSATWFINLSATRDNGAGTVLIEGGGGTAIAPTHSRGTGSAWRIDVTADTTNGGIAITVTGAAATTINWVARFSAAQVATAS